MDWNKDGQLDILSGCYWTDDSDSGHIQILAGKGPMEFAPAESLTDSEGDRLSNFKIDDDNKNSKQTQTICTHQHAVDYDGDGDLDLVVGCFANSFYLYKNSGQDGEPSLDKPVALPVESPSYHAAPHLVDWDADGDLDLLSGTGYGGVVWSENTGSRQDPQWADFATLIEAPGKSSAKVVSDGSIQPSTASRIWVTDWNGDGKLDILLGDTASIQKPEAKTRIARLESQMKASRDEAKPLRAELRQLRKDGLKPDDDKIVAVRDKLQELSDVYLKLSRELRGSQATERTGFVWLYVQSGTGSDVAKSDL